MRSLAQMTVSDAKVRAYLWVLEGNEPARRFYRRLGARDCGRRIVTLGGAPVSETRLVWDDFRIVAR
jgi:hypothetical protein